MGLLPIFRLISYLMMHTPPTSPRRSGVVLPTLAPLHSDSEGASASTARPIASQVLSGSEEPTAASTTVPVGPPPVTLATPDPDLGFAIVSGPPSTVSFAGLSPAMAEAFIAFSDALMASTPTPFGRYPLLRRSQFHRLPLGWINRRRASNATANGPVPSTSNVPATTIPTTTAPSPPPPTTNAPPSSTPAYNVHAYTAPTSNAHVPTASTGHASPKTRLSDLDFFSGTEPNPGLALDRWLQKLDAYGRQFPTFDDGDRIATAIMKLTGPALDWVRVNAPSPFEANAWLAFINTLEATFAPLNRSLVARAEFSSCRQISTVQDYLLRFNLASAPITDLFPAEKYQRFMEGLKPKIRKHIILNHPDVHEFHVAASLASRFDMLATYAASSTTATPPPRPFAPYRPPPARLNAVTSPTPTSTSPYTPLTPELRDSILAAGGCVYCRNVKPPLHTIESCPTRRPRPAFMLGNGRPQ